MRGTREEQRAMFSYATLERRIPQDHPLRGIRVLVDAALRRMDRKVDALYAKTCRPSIAPERRLRALPLQILYSIPAERRLIEQLDCNLLFRWFVGLKMDDAVWDVTVFTKNRERPIAGEVSQLLLAEVTGPGHEKIAVAGRRGGKQRVFPQPVKAGRLCQALIS